MYFVIIKKKIGRKKVVSTNKTTYNPKEAFASTFSIANKLIIAIFSYV